MNLLKPFTRSGKRDWTITITAGVMVLAFAAAFNYFSKPALSAEFPIDTKGLADAQNTESVTLKNGDTYPVTVKPVKRTIGGKTVRLLSYNGMVPGPTIQVEQGATVWLKVTNQLDLDTTLHPHGINADNKSDGVPDVTQPAIKPGQTYMQKLTFPDAGVFWYHPHIREDYTQASGLYANFIVKPKNDVWPAVDSQQAMTLGDIALGQNGILPFSRSAVDRTLMGRFGNVQLVNGKDNYSATVAAGSVIRYYLTNTASVRPFRFAIVNAQMKLIGADNGLYEQEKMVGSVTLAPSERAIVDVYFPQTGSYALQNQTPAKTYNLGTITAAGTPSTNPAVVARFLRQQTHPEVTASMAKNVARADAKPDKRLSIQLNMDMSLMGSMSGQMQNNAPAAQDSGIEWEDAMPAANAKSTTKNVSWSLKDLDSPDGKINWNFKKGEVVKIQIANKSMMHPMQHPVHIHGQRFIVTAIDGIKQTNLVWKDTVMIPAGHTYEVVVAMDNPGDWLIHCHIPEHMEAGMTGKFTVKQNV